MWLYAPHPQLQGQRAIDLIHAGRVEEIFRVLDRLDSDGYL
nr:antitoxin Xre/MbcA/ParS toxin-binding domain-containing protein [Flavimaribacter sediminis]